MFGRQGTLEVRLVHDFNFQTEIIQKSKLLFKLGSYSNTVSCQMPAFKSGLPKESHLNAQTP